MILKKNLKKEILLASVFILVVIAGYSLFSLIDNKEIYEGESYASNIEEVNQFFYEQMPGLKRAEREGIVQYINQELEFPGYDGSIVIDKVWYTQNQMYIFYHILGNSPASIDISIKGEDQSHYSYPYIKYDGINGIIYKDSIYNMASFANLLYSGNELSKAFTINFTLLYPKDQSGIDNEQMLINDQLLKPKDEGIEYYDVKLQADLVIDTNLDKQKVYSFDINQELDLGEHGKLKLYRLVLEPQQSYLTYEYINKDGYELISFVGNIKTANNESESKSIPYFNVNGPQDENGQMMTYFEALDDIPSEITIEVSGLYIMTDQQTKFEIPVEQYKGKLTNPMTVEKLNQNVGSIKGTDIILEQLIIDNMGINFTIYQDNGIDRNHELNHYFQGLSINTIEYQDLVDEEVPNVISFTNEKGEMVGIDDIGDINIGIGDKFSMYIYREFIEASKIVNITIDNLTYKVVGEWEGKFIVK